MKNLTEKIEFLKQYADNKQCKWFREVLEQASSLLPKHGYEVDIISSRWLRKHLTSNIHRGQVLEGVVIDKSKLIENGRYNIVIGFPYSYNSHNYIESFEVYYQKID